ncbi:FUSC family protein [Actinomadura sp. 7K507]|uniref:FUSC family protein n=1 Tax=Actinomadura sp. 7K507 TaxID=2530365 RepID=UPI00104FEE49|nr:FUSC family protein [Actinomadura sp. 7K507]TDC96984.1 hypothetical protein E1285_05065 [Actinomadura sp. 7K507]
MPFAGRRYWEERLKLTVKAVIAAVVAWVLAKLVVNDPQPYFAPLAALLGVYPTVVRSVRESFAYAAGFVLGAGIAIPVGLLIGPTTAGIVVVLVVAMMAQGWRRLGEQAPQVAFVALFALLLGGERVVEYTLPRLADVTIGLAVGLAVNALVFPPLYLRRGEYAVQELRDTLTDALETLAAEVVDPEEGHSLWDERESRLLAVQEQARYSVEQGESSLRANPRARWWGYSVRWRDVPGQWAPPRQLNALENVMSYTRSIAGTLRLVAEADGEGPWVEAAFRRDFAALLRRVAGFVPQMPETLDEEAFAEAERIQDELETPHRSPGTDPPGLWDPQKELLRLSRLLLDQVRRRGA